MVGIIFALGLAAGFYYSFVYRMRQIRRAQQQPTAVHVTEPPQELNGRQRPPLTQPGDSRFPQTDYASPPQPDYAPLRHSQVVGLPYPQQG